MASQIPEGFTLNYNDPADLNANNNPVNNEAKPVPVSTSSETTRHEVVPEGFTLQHNNPEDAFSPSTRKIAAQEDPLLEDTRTNYIDYFNKKGEDIVFNVEGDYKTMNKDLNIVRESYNKGDITLAEAALRIYGDGTNFLTDVVGETVISALGSVGDGISYIFPETSGAVKDAAKVAVSTIINTEVGRSGVNAIMDGMESYKEWKKINPRTAESIEAVFDTSVMLPTTQVSKIGGKTKLREFAENIKPKVSDKFKAKKPYLEMFDTDKANTLARTRTEKGIIFDEKTVDLDKRQERAIEALRETKNVNTNKSVSHNVVKVNDEIHDNLNPQITKEMAKGNPVNETSLLDDLDKAKDEIYSKSIDKKKTGDAIDEVSSRIDEALDLHRKPDGTITAEGMWEARKAIDKWYDKFEKDIASGTGDVGEVVYGLRDSLNRSIIDANPDLKPLFEKQAGLLFARDGMAQKGSKETGHLMTRVLRMAGVSRGVAIATVGLTGGAVGYMSVAAPVLAAAALGSAAYLVARGVYRYGLSPNARAKHLGTVLKGLDKAYTSAKKARNTELMRQIKADRSALIAYTNDAVETWNNGGKEEFMKDNPGFKE